MTNQPTQVHFTTSAEAVFMATVDSFVDNISIEDIHRILIDFNSIQDYMVQQLCNRFQDLGLRNYTTQACACVGASRYLYRNRNLATKKFKKITTVAK